ncbi:S9 family peptidase [Dyella monticola]|uniref:S9 family peptidase n=2 Tax=Dyella monticola TaxID=1927958 RepID=A0A370X9J6_9GAMM|nr:S9 family peptidase [Dyella monticola]
MPVIATAEDRVPVEAFATHASYTLPKLSPDGKYLALAVEQGDQHAVLIYQLDDMGHPKSVLRLPKFQVAGDLHWVGQERLVVELAKFVGSLDRPEWLGEIIATDVDGKRITPIFNRSWYVAGRSGDARSADEGYAFVAGVPVKTNDHFYMQTYMWDDENDTWLYDVNANNGLRHLIGQINMKNMKFMVDPDGNVRYAYGLNNADSYVLYLRQGSQWAPIHTSSQGITFEPITLSQDEQHLYVYSNTKRGPNSLVDMSPDGTHSTVLAKDDGFSSVDYIQWGPDDKPIAVGNAAGIPNPAVLDASQPLAQLYQGLSKKFPNDFIDFSSFSEDGSKLVFEAESDRNPGVYYLFDRKQMKIEKLFSENPAIDPNKMGARVPMHFKTDDGHTLEAILTVPAGASMNNLPMVLMPHGGPFEISDTWFYDDYAQFLASRGYLVLQINYRGSGGRGPGFVKAGYGKWGTRIQQDLIDGVKWAEDQHYADPARVCVFGGSFGGYSAMMTVIRAPDMFKCAIGYAGVYDLAMMYNKGSIKDGDFGKNYLKDAIGTDPAVLDANSPDKLADKITVPVFLIHGEDDERVPLAQVKAMRAALDAAHKPYEWLTKPGEGHGFYNEQNLVEMYNRIQAFLEKNIGPGVQPN